MSLRTRLVTDGYGPAVSLGVTAHDALLEVGSVVVDEVVVGEVTELLQPSAAAAPAPIRVSASRLPIRYLCMLSLILLLANLDGEAFSLASAALKGPPYIDFATRAEALPCCSH